MAKTGIRDILILNETVGKQKIKRLVSLRKSNRGRGTNDNYENTKNISSVVRKKEVRAGILIELNIGMHRRSLSPDKRFNVGEKIELILSHVCTIINSHGKYYGIRVGIVDAQFYLSKRGESLIDYCSA